MRQGEMETDDWLSKESSCKKKKNLTSVYRHLTDFNQLGFELIWEHQTETNSECKVSILLHASLCERNVQLFIHAKTKIILYKSQSYYF